jgi:hypothetical protein
MRLNELRTEEGIQGRLTKLLIDGFYAEQVKLFDAITKERTMAEDRLRLAQQEEADREAAARTPQGQAKKRRLEA